ncbi:uncharacterized protein LOC106660202 isoform X1 [Trichogramma pretiosum]|uniref:uncharacterized protein LOC106660202 isoform X1 n=1 Tax=Trichogramma pretiosum TaxID=7493 RepID=UPI0006C9762C|nr:uncharacterized protein LOC106660202 isoform X1 [Trichogramma pretiosum]
MTDPIVYIRILCRVLVLVPLICLIHVSFAIEYRTVLSTQRITHIDNDYVDFDVRYFGDEGTPYLTLKQTITPYNDLHIMLYAKSYDQAPILMSKAPLSLCQSLHERRLQHESQQQQHEASVDAAAAASGSLPGKNHSSSRDPLERFDLPQIFNLAGKTCPIAKKERVRLSPYILPAKFSSDVDLGCGYKNIEARLMKCRELPDDPAIATECETLMRSVSLTQIYTDGCTDEVIAEGWLAKQLQLSSALEYITSVHTRIIAYFRS